MSSSIKDLNEYDLIRRYSKSKAVCLKMVFRKDRSAKDGLHPQSKSCGKRKKKLVF